MSPVVCYPVPSGDEPNSLFMTLVAAFLSAVVPLHDTGCSFSFSSGGRGVSVDEQGFAVLEEKMCASCVHLVCIQIPCASVDFSVQLHVLQYTLSCHM